jgi:hypothetical protein
MVINRLLVGISLEPRSQRRPRRWFSAVTAAGDGGVSNIELLLFEIVRVL